MITLDGKKLRDFGMIMQAGHEHPMTPTISNKIMPIPGKAGVYYFGSDIGERVINLPLAFNDNGKAENQWRVREFSEFLNDAYGQPRAIKLSFDSEPDKYYMVRLSEQIIPERLYSTTSFTIPFIACDPYAYSVVYADEITWGSQIITFESSYLLGRDSSTGTVSITGDQALNILVDGLAIKPIIEITGSATSLTLTVNGYTINIPAFASATWLIDCDKYTVLKDGLSAFGLISLRDFILLPGSNQVQVSGTGINITMRIKFRDKYN